MPSVIATAGASDANSYVTVAEADTYFGEMFGRAEWLDSDVDDREACVISASRFLDLYMVWDGQRTTDAQSMDWPREGCSDRYNVPIPYDVIPDMLKKAAFETAYVILTKGGLNFGGKKYDKVKVAVVDLVYAKSQPLDGIPKYIEELLLGLGTPLLQRDGEAMVATLMRS